MSCRCKEAERVTVLNKGDVGKMMHYSSSSDQEYLILAVKDGRVHYIYQIGDGWHGQVHPANGFSLCHWYTP